MKFALLSFAEIPISYTFSIGYAVLNIDAAGDVGSHAGNHTVAVRKIKVDIGIVPVNWFA